MSDEMPAQVDKPEDTQPPENTEHPNNTAIYYQTALITAAVAFLLCLVVMGLLIWNYVQAKAIDPLQPTRIDVLKAELSKQPENARIKQEIRELDLQIRQKYFRTRTRAIRGAYVLAGSLIVLLLSIHFAIYFRRKLPAPHPERAGNAWIEAAMSRRAMLVLALLMVSILKLYTEDLISVQARCIFGIHSHGQDCNSHRHRRQNAPCR